jgi:hypothetical protein
LGKAIVSKKNFFTAVGDCFLYSLASHERGRIHLKGLHEKTQLTAFFLNSLKFILKESKSVPPAK